MHPKKGWRKQLRASVERGTVTDWTQYCWEALFETRKDTQNCLVKNRQIYISFCVKSKFASPKILARHHWCDIYIYIYFKRILFNLNYWLKIHISQEWNFIEYSLLTADAKLPLLSNYEISACVVLECTV